MNTNVSLSILALVTLALIVPQLRAQDATTPGADTPSGPIPAPSANGSAPIIPTSDFQPARYESLWKKSPFSVATPDSPTDTSPDYILYGLANIDGITYASLFDQHSSEHFLVSSDKPTRGITLSGITRGQNGGDTFANVLKDGQTLTLKLSTAAAAPAGQPPPGMNLPPLAGQIGTAQQIVPNIQVPGSNQGFPGRDSARPFPRIHRPRITLPPAPQAQAPAAPTPPPPPQPAPAQ